MNLDELSKWDCRFIELANQVATWSKGPRTRVGAVVVRQDRSIASLGYNGAPRGYDDAAFMRLAREDQHAVVIHAEANAIGQAHEGESLAGMTLYVSPMLPCNACARRIVAAGIVRVVAYCGQMSEDWRASAEEAKVIFETAGVKCLFIQDSKR